MVGLYHNPPEKAVVLCVDEKSQIQALDRSQPVLPMIVGLGYWIFRRWPRSTRMGAGGSGCDLVLVRQSAEDGFAA